jgi:hypothetical protein
VAVECYKIELLPSPFYGPERSTYLPENNSCPAGHHSTTAAKHEEPHLILISRPANVAANMLEFANAQRQKKKVEALFAELKNQIGLRRPAPAKIEVRA